MKYAGTLEKENTQTPLFSVSKMVQVVYLICEKCINVTWKQLALSH